MVRTSVFVVLLAVVALGCGGPGQPVTESPDTAQPAPAEPVAPDDSSSDPAPTGEPTTDGDDAACVQACIDKNQMVAMSADAIEQNCRQSCSNKAEEDAH